MTLNIGENFQQRWLDTPETVRHSYCDHLRLISELLNPETQLQKWLYQEAVAHQRHKQISQQAYQKRKDELLESQQVKQNTTPSQAQNTTAQPTNARLALPSPITAENHPTADTTHISSKNNPPTENPDKIVSQATTEDSQKSTESSIPQPIEPQTTPSENTTEPTLTHSEQQDLKTLLEIEAEYYIEQALIHMKQKLQRSAEEEIHHILSRK